MQFVEDQEAQTSVPSIKESLVVGTHKHVFSHYIVGEYDLRRGLSQEFSSRVICFPGVFRVADGKSVAPSSLIVVLQLIQRLELRVDERIHGIDHQRRDSVADVRPAEKIVEDG